MCKILKLPELTFPVLALCIGYPNENPQLKPRMDMEYRVFEDEYTTFDNYLKELEGYDKEMSNYYVSRDKNRRTDSFTDQVVAQLLRSNPRRQKLLNAIKKMGFDTSLESE